VIAVLPLLDATPIKGRRVGGSGPMAESSSMRHSGSPSTSSGEKPMALRLMKEGMSAMTGKRGSALALAHLSCDFCPRSGLLRVPFIPIIEQLRLSQGPVFHAEQSSNFILEQLFFFCKRRQFCSLN
jgi:hypothetical protein